MTKPKIFIFSFLASLFFFPSKFSDAELPSEIVLPCRYILEGSVWAAWTVYRRLNCKTNSQAHEFIQVNIQEEEEVISSRIRHLKKELI